MALSTFIDPNWQGYQDAAAGTTRDVPVTVNGAGDRITLIVAVPSSTVPTPAGFTLVGLFGTSFPKIYVFYRDLTASIGTTITVTTVASVKVTTWSGQINAGDYVSGVAPIAAGASGTSTTPNAPSLSTSWTSANPVFYYIAFAATTFASSFATAPSGYGNNNAKFAATSVPGVQTNQKWGFGVSAEDPAAWGAIASTAWSAVTIAIRSKIGVVAPLRTNVQTFYAPKIRASVKAPARFDNAQTFYAPSVSVAVTTVALTQTARLDNTQAFFAPSIRATVAASFATNAQGFYAPVVTVRIAPALAANVQAFYAPKIRTTVKPALHTNAQVFYAPTVKPSVHLFPALHTNAQGFFAPKLLARLKAPLHANAQVVFAPKLAAKVTQTARLDNAQAFFATKLSERLVIAARHDNAQTMFAPKLAATYKPGARFDNPQAFYGPKVAATVRLIARLDNAQAFYPPALRATVKAPSHVNAQLFFAPSILRVQRIQPPRFDNTVSIYLPTVARTQQVQVGARFDNAQAFYLPLAVNRVGAPVQAPPHVNAQQFFAPKIYTTVKQAAGGASGWDLSGSYVLDTEYVGAHYVTPLTLVQDSAGNLTGVGGSAPYTWTVNSGSVVGNTFEFFATYDTLVINQHHVGTIAPDGTISGTWTDDYSGGRVGTFTTTSGAAISVPGGAGFENQQTFYGPRVAPQAYVTPPRLDNGQGFFAPAIRLSVKAVARFDNAQAFFAPSLHQEFRLAPPRHTNAQQFFAPTIKVALRAARHDNPQAFFPARLAARLAAPRLDNAQAFYGPRLGARLAQGARLGNAQAFYAPGLAARLRTGARHENAQGFFDPTLRATYRVAARFDNAQAFLPTSVVVKVANIVVPNLHLNAQAFFGPTITFAVPPIRDPAGALRMFEDARFEFTGHARLTIFTGTRLTEFSGMARVTEFDPARRTVFRSRLIEGTFVT